MPKGLPVIPQCVHGNSKQGYKCNDLTVQDYSKFHRNFYSTSVKVTQDTFLLKYCTAQTPKKEGKRKSQTICYFIPKHENLAGRRRVKLIKVCQKAMTTILGISRDRIQRICKQHLITMAMPKERRGGNRKSNLYSDRTESVKSFIKGLEALESHYVRGRSTVQYLSSDLSIKKLHKLYNDDAQNVSVRYEFFRRIFNKYFNLSFKSPATDACSKCIQLKEVIKRERDTAKKQLQIAQLRIHKLKAKCFYTSLKTQGDNEIIFSFDCQKNLVLPKVPDQSAYFSRQLYTYNLTVCQGPSRGAQNCLNTFIYTWLETEAKKGSNQIASAVFHRLMNTNFEDTVSHIKLFCDGCGGQNKNSIVLGMLAYWLKTKAPRHIKKLTLIFPVVGHSFLPPDRVFGNIEREIRPLEVIVEPQTYFDIFKKYGTVLRLGSDFHFYDWKSSVKNVLKLPGSWHFQFNASKRFFLRKDKNNRIAIKGEPNYVSEVINYGNVCKRGKSFENIVPVMMNVGVPVKPVKLNDVRNLLKKHFGEDWASYDYLQYYNFLQEEPNETVIEETDNEETIIHEEIDLRV
uniref:DUF7869 domain-containing protein n=1 Tax=Pararge aegeria TaxID=116150 RepID=S4PMR1_9NEOP